MTMEEGSKVTEPSSPGDEFELTADMMVNDFDDERTLDEEEALEESEEQQAELSNLEKEGNIPLSALLAMYGYAGQPPDEEMESDSNGSEDESEVVGPGDKEETNNKKLDKSTKSPKNPKDMESPMDTTEGPDCKNEPIEQTEGEPEPRKHSREVKEEKQPSMLQELYKDDPSTSTVASRHLRSGSRQHSEDEEDEEDEDGDYSPEEDDWKKTIMVGSDYQAAIPDSLHKYDDAMPYENEDKLLWDPSHVPDKDVKDYLSSVQNIQISSDSKAPTNGIPKGSHVRDDEQALYLLLQCGHNVEEAYRRQKINSVPCSSSMSLWSEEECRNFESGLFQYGKDFPTIQQNKVRTRTIGELVQFYYLWKKTERHDRFAAKNRLEKKKWTLHPGTTDFMERFLDDQESPFVGSPSSVFSLISCDPKRITRTTTPGHQPQQSHTTGERTPPPDSSNAINNHVEQNSELEPTISSNRASSKQSTNGSSSPLGITAVANNSNSTHAP